MRRFLRSTLALSVILSLVGAVPSFRTRAASPIASGKWTGYFSRDMVITNDVGGVMIEATGNSRGDLTLQVDGNGDITGSLEPYHAEIEWSASAVGVKGSCKMDFAWNVTSGTVSENAAYLPVFDLQLDLTYSNVICDPEASDTPPYPKNTAHFEALTASGGKITGDKVRFQTDQVEMVLSSMAQVGAQVSLFEYWELNSSGASVDLITPEFEQYFLAGVPFQNTYTALVDWHGNPPGKVAFTLAGQTQEAPGEAEVSAAFDLGGVPAGKNPLLVTAYSPDGQPSGSLAQDVIIVPLEPWAQKANFAAGETKQDGIQYVVIYQGKTNVPAQPIELPYLDLSDIPVIGGKWGVPPFQVEVTMRANSGGGLSDPAPVSGKAGLFLGGATPELSMKVDGQAVTELTESALLFDHGQANFNLDPFTLERNVGLVDLIPAAAALYSIPVVGDLIKGANSVLGITLQLTAQAKGQGDLAVAADKSQLVFEKGDITPSVLVYAKPGVNIPSVITLGVGGGGKGEFTIRIAPNPGLENCLVSLEFTANIAVLNLVNESYHSPPYQVAKCKQTVMGGRTVLAVYLPQGLSEQLQAEAYSQEAAPQAATRSQARQDAAGAILVSGASPQAELDLALGPQGRMAFIYTSEDQGRVSLRMYDGQAWDEAIQIGEAGRIGISPVTAFDESGQVVVAWVQPAASGTPTASELEAYARSWEIAYAVVDSRGQIVEQGSLTKDDKLDFAPQLARAADGSLWLAWLQSPAINLWGPKDNPNSLQAARWDGKSWGRVETVYAEVVGALGFRLAVGDRSNAMVVASLDADGDPLTSSDREIYAFRWSSNRWSGAQRITNDAEMDAFPLAAYTSDGAPVLAWQRGGSVVGLEGELRGAPEIWAVGNTGQIPDLAGGGLLAGAPGELALVWPAFSENSQGVWVSQRLFRGADWQTAKPLVDGLGGTGQLSAKLAQDGSVWIGLAQLQVPSSNQDLSGLGQVSVPGLPASADLAVVGVGGVMEPRPENAPAAAGAIAKPSGSSNSTRILLTGAACLFALVVLGGGGMLLVLKKRRRRPLPIGVAGRR